MENAPNYLFIYCRDGSVLAAYLHFSRGDCSSFGRKNFGFCGISMVVYL